jgi:SAM-dependent methyltransferase
MTPADDPASRERLARERADADRAYNDALTALDRAATAAIAADAPTRADIARAVTALIVYLQQITAFVDTKDREIAAHIDLRLARIERALESIPELRSQMTALQRAAQTLSRTQHPAPAPGTPNPAPRTHPAPGTLNPAPDQDYKYVAFEDEFRGTPDAIAARLAAYVPIFAGAQDVIDLGCGRGEFLAALAAAGVRARGVDLNADMAAIARERGLDAVHGDALAFLESLPDESAGGLVATQVVEHLEPGYLLRLLDAAARKLRRGAPIVLETINVACWLAFFSSYLRDFTHVRPIHPETLQFLLRASGFERVEIRYSAPVPEPMKMKTVDVPPALASSGDPLAASVAAIAHAVSVNAAILNNLMFTSMDYAVVGYRV